MMGIKRWLALNPPVDRAQPTSEELLKEAAYIKETSFGTLREHKLIEQLAQRLEEAREAMREVASFKATRERLRRELSK